MTQSDRLEAYPTLNQQAPSTPTRAARLTNKGFLSMTLDQYLSLLDGVGRVIRSDKRGWIPRELPGILQRLALDPQSWLDSLLDRFAMQDSVRPPTPAIVHS